MVQSDKEPQKHTNFSKEQITKYLVEFKELIKNDYFTISLNNNRQENIRFMEDYNITTKKAKHILLCLETLDFCYAVDNNNPKIAHEMLYIFCKMFTLDNRGTKENIDIYIKVNSTKTRKGNNIIIIVSFHKRNKPIQYCFKEV